MNSKRWKCAHCGRNLGDRVPHRCKGNMRYRNLRFKDRSTGIVFKQDKVFGWVPEDSLDFRYKKFVEDFYVKLAALFCEELIAFYIKEYRRCGIGDAIGIAPSVHEDIERYYEE